MLVQNFLERTARRLPGKTALVCGRQRLTYADVEAQANRLANALRAAGVRRGDRVAIVLGNRIETVVAIFAALKAGAVFVVLPPTTRDERLRFVLNHCEATALIARDDPRADFDLADVARSTPSLHLVVVVDDRPRSGLPGGWQALSAIQRECSDARPPAESIDLDLACLVYTSGSTGEPKGVMCDHGNMVFVAGSVIEYLEIAESDVILNVLPLAFSYGLYQVLMAFKVGGTVVLEDSFAFPVMLLQRLAAERVTGLPGVPTLFASLLQQDLSKFDLSHLRFATNAAAAMSPAHILAFRAALPAVRFYSMYGLTETKRALFLPPEHADARPDSVGFAIPGTEVWLEDAAGRRVGVNEVGELVVRGRHVMRGYWNAPEESARRFRPGPLPGERVCHTGDLFRRDAAGFLYYVGRTDDIIKIRGHKVAPKRIEDVLYSHGGVVEAAVVGIPHPVFGSTLKAVVAVSGGVTSAELMAHCHAHLEEPFVPASIDIRECLPKTASGKLLRKALVD